MVRVFGMYMRVRGVYPSRDVKKDKLVSEVL
jgi:hypothetical protein